MEQRDAARRGIRFFSFVFFAIGLTVAAYAGPRIAAFGPPVRYVGVHGTYSFRVTAYGGHLAYQWWHQEPDSPEGHPIPVEEGFGSNKPRLRVTDAQMTRDYDGWYWCVVSNTVTGESVTSPRGEVFVIGPPAIVQNPQSQTVRRGSRVEFNVESDPQAPVRQKFQWFFNDKPIAGATRSRLVILTAGLRREGVYYCRVTTIGGAAFSTGAVLNITE